MKVKEETQNTRAGDFWVILAVWCLASLEQEAVTGLWVQGRGEAPGWEADAHMAESKGARKAVTLGKK